MRAKIYSSNKKSKKKRRGDNENAIKNRARSTPMTIKDNSEVNEDANGQFTVGMNERTLLTASKKKRTRNKMGEFFFFHCRIFF